MEFQYFDENACYFNFVYYTFDLESVICKCCIYGSYILFDSDFHHTILELINVKKHLMQDHIPNFTAFDTYYS